MCRQSKKAAVGRTLFTILIVITAVISSAATYALVSHSQTSARQGVSDSSLISPIANMFPIAAGSETSSPNHTTTTTSCYTGNWTAIYAAYEAPLSNQENTTGLGQQYLSDPQFMSFLSQYLNMTDPQVNATVYGLLSGNETAFVQQELQSQGLLC